MLFFSRKFVPKKLKSLRQKWSFIKSIPGLVRRRVGRRQRHAVPALAAAQEARPFHASAGSASDIINLFFPEGPML
jgi:hypothetical protein